MGLIENLDLFIKLKNILAIISSDFFLHMYLNFFPILPQETVLSQETGASIEGIPGCLLLPRSSLMLWPFGFVHPFSPVSHFRVFICYQVSFFPCNVQFAFNLISIFLISDSVFHPKKFDLHFFFFVSFI